MLEKHKIIRGPVRLLTEELRAQLLSLDITGYGFTGVCKNAERIEQISPEVIMEKPQVEDVMLAYIGGEKCIR